MSAVKRPELYYDNSCGLCRAEIRHLAPRLSGHIDLVDISQSDFTGAHGVDVNSMQQRMHLWTGDHFLTGLDATLFYWKTAGFGWVVAILKVPGIHQVARFCYDTWARRRASRLGYCEIPERKP